jgi:predicted Rossmann-fold nucleotide-binding protein
MGVLASTARRHGARTVGVIPQAALEACATSVHVPRSMS